MYVSELTLQNYRNLRNITVNFNKKGNIFYGVNGIGKTNLLEAIAYQAYGKSFKAAADSDLINYEADFFRISAKFYLHYGEYSFEAAVNSKGQKKIRINNVQVSRLSELYKMLKTIIFSQEDINIISGTPRKRRSFFDLAISQSNFYYLETIREYSNTLKQRNALLKTDFSTKEKEIWDKRLAVTAARVLRMRIEYLSDINKEINSCPIFSAVYSAEKLLIQYKCRMNISKNRPLIDTIYEELQKHLKDEVYYQRTLIGPHLDDYLFLLNSKDIARFGSHGQKRSFIILLGLAQSRLVSRNDNDAAVMVFDDVLSDLDEKRTASIIKHLKGNNQIFVATPNPVPYRNLGLPMIDLHQYTRKTNQ